MFSGGIDKQHRAVMSQLALSTVNKCTIAIVIIIITDVESFLEEHFFDFIQEAIWKNQLYSDERSETLTNSGRNLTWAYELKALISYS